MRDRKCLASLYVTPRALRCLICDGTKRAASLLSKAGDVAHECRDALLVDGPPLPSMLREHCALAPANPLNCTKQTGEGGRVRLRAEANGVRQDFDILETGGDTGGAEESKSAVAQPASAAPTAKECPADTNALAVGEFIALRDDPSAAQFHIGKIVDKDADKINVHVYGTQNHSIKVAKYKPLWMVLGQQSSKGSQVEFKLPKEEDRDERRFLSLRS